MKNKKCFGQRALGFAMALLMGASLIACGGDKDTQKQTESEVTSTVAITEESTVEAGKEADEPAGYKDPYADWKVLGLSFEGNVDDSSSYENHGTLNKEGTYVEGISGQALYFDGKTYVDLGSEGSLQPAKLTFVSWIKVDGKLAGEHMITWFKPNGNYKGEGWYLSCLDDGTPLKLSVGKSAGQPMEIFVSGSRSDFFPDGEWVHIAVTYDSDTHTATMYRNGVAQNVQYINAESEINEDSKSKKLLSFKSGMEEFVV